MSDVAEAERDYQLTIRVHNNRILSRIRAKGYPSLASFCRANGLPYTVIAEIVRLKKAAVKARGGFAEPVLDLAAALGVDPEDLFTERQARGAFKSAIVRNVDEDEIISLSAPEAQLLIADQAAPDEEIGRKRVVAQFLNTLTPREQEIVRRRYGFGGPEMTYTELAAEMGITNTRVAQIEAKALRKAKRPSQMRLLRHYADPSSVARCEAELQEEARRREEWEKECRRREDENRATWAEARRTSVLWQNRELEQAAVKPVPPTAGPTSAEDIEPWTARANEERYCWQCRFADLGDGDPMGNSWICHALLGYRTCRDMRSGKCGEAAKLFDARRFVPA